MPRPRVLSFMSQWGSGSPKAATPSNTTPALPPPPPPQQAPLAQPPKSSPTSKQRSRADSRPSSRPISMVQTYHPPVMEVASDTPPELQPIFIFLNSHSNKLYQEGYFLKLHDLDVRGRPSVDRTWTECFAQLVGTVLSLWDAHKLDEAGQDGEVIPTFINLADASIKMIESLPMNGNEGQTLNNVLSVSTAASNRYLLHFNSLNSLTQWTAGIRLAMFEHATLQEAYTGSLIAGKGKTLNNIRPIMEKMKWKWEDWARVRFGAGTPWRRCWCVITPPDEKEVKQVQKAMKKQSAYDRSTPIVKGVIRFYETRKVNKKTRPIATITDAYSAYAVYPHSKPLIDASTLVKVEGRITIHSSPESTTEGFVFVMPEVHPAVSGFEMMLRFLFPVFDVFALYGRPQRLVADPMDSRSLMFAMPRDRRYGYLDILDVASLIHTDGSQGWSERQWRKQMKDLTSKRIATVREDGGQKTRRNTFSRTSLPPSRTTSIRFNDGDSTHSQPTTRHGSPAQLDFNSPRRMATMPNGGIMKHQRSVSEANMPARLGRNRIDENYDDENPPPLPVHRFALNGMNYDTAGSDGYSTPDEGDYRNELPEVGGVAAAKPLPSAVLSPPAFSHAPGERPRTQPGEFPDLRRAQSEIDQATLQEMNEANSQGLSPNAAAAGGAAAWAGNKRGNDRGHQMHSSRRSIDESHNQWAQHNERLPTIPASPFIAQGEPLSATSGTFAPTGPPVPEHREPGYFPHHDVLAESAADRRSLEAGEHTQLSAGLSPGHAIQRKPVPGRLNTPPPADNAASPASPSGSSLGSLRNEVIDPDMILSQLAARDEYERAQTMASSIYDDESSGSRTPDYASTKSPSVKSERISVDKPRTGRLKTVGDIPPAKEVVVGDANYKEDKPAQSIDLPVIDFGPTYDLTKSSGRPGTSGSMTGSHERSKSKGSDDARRTSPSPVDHGRAHSRSPNSSDNRRSVAWQPASGRRSASPGAAMALNPEDWVQQRAAQAATPVFGHGQHLRGKSDTPPISRTTSGDWSGAAAAAAHHQRDASTPLPIRSHSRTPSAMLPVDRSHSRTPSAMMLDPAAGATPPLRPHSRTHSRSPSALLLTQPQGGLLINAESATLSAREQQEIARATGTPLLNMTDNHANHHAKDPKSEPRDKTGLVGAIAAREKEKADLKSGSRSALLQQAIAARQHQAAQEQARAHAAAQQRAAQMQIQQAQQQQIWQQQQLLVAQQQAQQNQLQLQYAMMGATTPTPTATTPMGFGQQGGYFPQMQPQQQMQMPQQQQMGMGQMQQSPQMQQQAYGASWDRSGRGQKGHRKSGAY
ncbi:uncharacterized protein K452DRAFT_294294 [Aplosporella prunicola CBS 121167]|uniref:PH domain-containing protein n=1 Tax=Aplosporella prunicola CBS 121167 TaxID=1176127 RepID=A0A6A6BVN1_9PEZI|nr:uncharacterized protein K452DRAFT_294294 [Aplosporella prunicola CBS 121167]KAF2146751.1 hypothetical protein K452DRAFT_294294 [Aplosporella prunicola CBS 121167]